MISDPATLCPTCNGSGWEIVPGPARKARHCPACDYWDRVRGTAPGIPEGEREASLENYIANRHNGTAITHGRLFVEGVHHGLYLWGPVGTGKTRLACSILNDRWKAGDRVRFIRVPELLIRLQPSSDDDPDVLIRDLASVPVLCLDDVGANAGTDFSRRMLQVLFDAREDRNNRTIWTSNLTPDLLGTFLSDARLPSRIVGACRIIELGGPDQRTLREPRPARKSKPTDGAQPSLKGSKW